MNELTVQPLNIPTTVEDLSKFVLVGREKLTSVRAEIRAINKLQLAEEVRNQKKDEAMMLSEALLDAEVRLGDLLKQIPKATPNNNPFHEKDSTVQFVKPKKEVIQDLGFTEKQAQRFETLAENKDLVDRVKAEARENDDIPTRTRVLDLAKERKRVENQKSDDYNDYIDRCAKTAKTFTAAMYDIESLDVSESSLREWWEMLNGNTAMIEDYTEKAISAISKMQKIQQFLRRCKQ